MDRLKLGYEKLSAINPRLIYVSMSGYGHNGPRRDWTSMNMNLQGYSGLMTVSGAEDDPPTAISNSWTDYIGGLHACFAILQAIDERRESAKGRRIDLSQFECSAVDGKVPVRRGNRSDRYAPQGVYPCAGKDNWCALSVQTDDQWQALTKLIGQERWATDARFENLAGRCQYPDEIDQAISAWSKQYSSQEVEARLRAAGISADRMRRINEVVDGAAGSTVFSQMAERRVGSMRTTKLPFTLSSVDLPTPASAPSLGEHSGEVLRAWINCSDADIESLKRDQVLQ
jgi:benzylsuccinate CoA-transferase BbsF subunit